MYGPCLSKGLNRYMSCTCFFTKTSAKFKKTRRICKGVINQNSMEMDDC